MTTEFTLFGSLDVQISKKRGFVQRVLVIIIKQIKYKIITKSFCVLIL
jgi:hypothetical protein